MRHSLRVIFTALFFTGILFSCAYCEELQIAQLVDQFKQGTDVQRDELQDFYKDKEIVGFGTVENAREYNTFDEANDIERTYHEVITNVQKTARGNPYKVIFIYKNSDKIKNIDRGQAIEKRAKILRVIDDRLWISVWLYEEEFTPEEKLQFRQFWYR